MELAMPASSELQQFLKVRSRTKQSLDELEDEVLEMTAQVG